MATKKKRVKAPAKNTGKLYEQLVEQVIIGLLKLEGDGFKNLRVVRDEKLDAITRGEDGKPLKRQIDVYWEFDVGGLVYRTIIQAKDLNRKIMLGMVDTFKTVLSDLPGQPRGIIITKKGAQAGALKFAKAHGIGSYHLREAVEQDFAGGVIPTLDYYVSDFFPQFTKSGAPCTV